MRMTAAQYREMVAAKPKRRHKYGAVPAFRCGGCDGALAPEWTTCPTCGSTEVIRFDSTAEATRFDVLRQMERAGLITDLERQVRFPIVLAGQAIADYIADFVYRDAQGERHVEDTKGFDTATSRLKRKAVEAGHGITIEVVR